jgi:thiamine-monophosphate kinase
LVGIGDDAAVLQGAANGQLVVTTDMLMDGVDFQLAECDPARVGRKALAVNLSDLAAMAARPVAAFVSVALPQRGGMELAKQLYGGLLRLAEQFEIAIAGGDTNSWDGPLVVSITAIGSVGSRGPLLRSGAKPGDAILVTGSLGGSILGKHFDFEPRVRESLYLQENFQLHAGIDVSDGLSLDVSRMAKASGCGAELNLSDIPIDPAAVRLSEQAADGTSPLDHALGDGEDFELVLAAAPREAERMIQMQPLSIPVRCIGRFVPEPGLWSIYPDGQRRPLVPRGYEHPLT